MRRTTARDARSCVYACSRRALWVLETKTGEARFSETRYCRRHFEELIGAVVSAGTVFRDLAESYMKLPKEKRWGGDWKASLKWFSKPRGKA